MAYVLQQLLAKSAKAYPDKPAVWARGKSVTYRELDERSNQLAHFLVEKGIDKGDRVGLFFPKCVESIISMLGVLKSGGVYVPLDPQAPADRTGYIIGNCGIRILITNSDKRSGQTDAGDVECAGVLHSDGGRAGDSGGDRIAWSRLAEFPAAHAPEVSLIETDLAYILYTLRHKSGTAWQGRDVVAPERADVCGVVRGRISNSQRRPALESRAVAF